MAIRVLAMIENLPVQKNIIYKGYYKCKQKWVCKIHVRYARTSFIYIFTSFAAQKSIF